MKKLALVALTGLLLSGCGPLDMINSGCGGDARGLCDFLFGRQQQRIEENKRGIKENADRIKEESEKLESLMAMVITQLNSIGLNIDSLKTQISTLQIIQSSLLDKDVNLQEQIDMLLGQASVLEEEGEAQQSLLDQAFEELAVLQGYESIVEHIDPCGPTSGYDEVLMKTSKGNLIGYFEQGSKRFLTLLKSGNYQTTDNQACVFKVDADLNVEHTVPFRAKRLGLPDREFEDLNVSGLKAAYAPSTVKIVNTTFDNSNTFWVELTLGNISYCYQANAGNSGNFTLKHSKVNMAGPCEAASNNDNVLQQAANTKIETSTIFMRAGNNAKNGSTLVETTVEAKIKILE